MSTDPTTIADDQAVDVVEPVADEPEQVSVEQLAGELGWKPKSAFAEGEMPKNWRPASEWMRTTHLMNKRLNKELAEATDTVKRLASSATKQTERALKEQAAEINAKFAAAVEAKDVKGAADATLEMQQLQREATAETGGDVEATFAKQNPWYGKDEDATDYAVSISQREARKGKTVPEQLEAVDKAVRKRFPELFDAQTPAPKPQPSVATPSRGTPPKRERGFADMPAAARQAAEQFAKLAKEKHGKDPEVTKKEYAADYWSDQAAA